MRLTPVHFRGPYAITDAALLPDQGDLLLAVEEALIGGVRVVQFRDKQPPEQLTKVAAELVQLCHRFKALLLINDHLDLALEVGADGVHLGQEDKNLEEAVRRGGPEFIVGATCHDSLDLALRAVAQGAQYVAFGRFFSSSTKPGASPAPLDILSAARSRIPVPLVAIGGINLDNAAQVLSQGADMVAVVHALFGMPRVRVQAQAFCRLIRQTQNPKTM